jgi:hypothetical protein
MCLFNKCSKPIKSKGFCAAHYEQLRNHKTLTILRPNNYGNDPCAIEGCKNRIKAKNLCQKHYDVKRVQDGKRYNPEKAMAWNLKHKFGITLLEYEKIRETQNYGCAICGLSCISGKRLAVDHNHITGLIRGLLCMSCNTAIGLFKENSELFFKASLYLKHSSKST